MRLRFEPEQWGDEADPRLRVLLECEPSASPSIVASVLERHGYSVRVCEGPTVHRCSLLEKGACELVDGTDVVVNMLHETGDGPTVHEEVLAGRRPPAVVLEMTPTADRGSAGNPSRAPYTAKEHLTVLETPVNTAKLIVSVERAVAARDRPVPIWGDGFC